MASTSTSSAQRSFVYDVFLSFRGEDVRKSFVDHLFKALNDSGIIIYKDDKSIIKGEEISNQLITAIKGSKFHIIIFSKNYANSAWCLEELVHIMECQKTEAQTAYPIFYDVQPTEVRNLSGPVGKAFTKQLEKESTGRWRDAMKEASNLAGWELMNTGDGHEVQFIKKVVADILQNQHFINFSIDSTLVGMATRIEKLLSSLQVDIDDIRVIGIKGMGGGGKTTLARAVFDHISSRFEGRSFVENVRERSKSSGLHELQKQILRSVFNDESIGVTGVSDGKNLMKRMMPRRKALVVLDDVDNVEQLEALADGPTWFKPGSRVIVTTRDHQVLARRVQSDNIHDLNMLSNDEAICLFSKHAFNADIPDQGFEDLSERVVQYAVGLPLTIKTLGSSLCGRPKDKWVDTINRLKTIPSHDTLKRLEISYDGLEEDQKQIFLYVACLVKGETEEKAIRILEMFGFHARIGLSVLEQKSLITLPSVRYGVVALHDRLEEMGENIVRRLHPDEPRRHMILWKKDEIEDILVNELGTEEIRSLKLLGTSLHPATISQGLRKMTKLRFLYISPENYARYASDKINEADGYLPNTLRFLSFPGYCFRHLPRTFQADNLVHLQMPGNKIHQLWEGEERKVLPKLKFLDLSWSRLETFDLGITPNLEELFLSNCQRLVEVNATVECPHLKRIDLTYCHAFEVFNISNKCPHLETLEVMYVKELQMHGEFSKLKTLDFRYCKLTNLNLGLTPHLRTLCLRDCRNFVELHVPVKCPKLIHLQLSGFNLSDFKPGLAPFLEKLETLTSLYLSFDDIECLPDSILMLKHLDTLYLDSCRHLKQLPEDLGRLECLETLSLTDCSSIQDIPTSICKMKCLKSLNLARCLGLNKLPDEFGCLKSLKWLDVTHGCIKNLSQSISQLKGLKVFNR